MEIRETQIEDILISSPMLMQKIFGLNEAPHLIGRQIILPTGRLDMLYTYQKDLFLIELKVAGFQKKFIKQLLNYKNDLLQLQNQEKLIHGEIKPFLMIPKVNEINKKTILENGIFLQEYNPAEILQFFYSEKLRPITSFSELKPIDIGIWNIHLINKFIYFLKESNSIKKILQLVGGSSKTLYNKIKFSNELGLVNWNKNHDFISLSELGEKYVEAKDDYFKDRMSESQAKILKDFVMQNPYKSSVILGIASIIECVFLLSKTSYPVSLKYLENYFSIYSGKIHDWQSEKAKKHGAKIYSNYAIDLGLMAKSDENIFLTPEGFKFVIQMQLHKSLKLMNDLIVT